MMDKNEKLRKLTMGLFVIYFVILTWVILFNMQIDIFLLQNMN